MKLLGLSFLAGLLGALGFAPLDLWPLTLVSVAALLWLVESAPRLRSALARGWWFGVGHFILGLNWIATAFTYQAAMPAWLGWVAVVLLSLYLAV
jgi:apolipoprotein N-acyltransferase